MKINNKIILNALNSFKGLPHRQQKIFINKKFQIINDSKSTSFESSLAALKSYTNIYWILGGLPKLKDKIDLKFVKQNLNKAYIVGKNTKYFARQLKNKINFKISYTISKAVNSILKDLKISDKFATILFSPSGASFDQFKNFENRGKFLKSSKRERFLFFKLL